MKNRAPKKSQYCVVWLISGAAFALTPACAGPTPQSESANPVEPTSADQHPIEAEPMTAETAVIYRINDQTVSEDEFNAFILKLEVEPEPYVTADMIDEDMGYAGWEAGYHAKDPKTGQAYQLYETQMGDHHSKSLSLLTP